VRFELPSSARLLALATASVLLVAWVTAVSGSAATPGCASFGRQAEAQDYFAERGGSPRHRVGDLDRDRDGVACEELPAPFKGFATIGYNLKRNFFYGTVAMPPAAAAAAGEKLACLYGNRHFAEGPRLLKVYRVQPGPDQAVTDVFPAEAKPSSGYLIWKAEKKVVVRDRYYVAFEERVPISPYGANECPGFRSAEVALPLSLSR
jgi:hypothetical protein